MDKVERAVIELDGDWPGSIDKHWLYRYAGTGRLSVELDNFGRWETVCTYDEFMETRKRLENKPTEWPEGADFLVQNSCGAWQFGKSNGATVEPGQAGWRIKSVQGVEFFSPVASIGLVFGDWRQSLEPRPQPDHKEGEGVKWMPEEVLISSVQGYEVEFGTGCREVSFGEGVKWDGEGLPPVGSFVAFNKEVYFDNGYTADEWDDGDRLEVIAHRTAESGSTALILWNEKDKTADSLVKHVIRPLQSHRDKVIEAAEQHIPVRLAHKTKDLRVIFSNLYDYGMLKLPEGE